MQLRAIAVVESSLTDLDTAPMQGREGAPDAWLPFDPAVRDALDGLRVHVSDLETLDRTPVVDVKPMLRPS